MENLEEVVHVEGGWTTSQNGVETVDMIYSIWHKTDGYGRN
jgi:hypothetical protein